MQDADGILTNMAIIFHLLLGVWGLFRAIRLEAVDGSYLGAIVIGWGLFVVTAVLDLLLWLNGVVPNRAEVHYLYAVFAIVFVPFTYFVLLRGDDSNRGQWVLGFATMFMWGVGMRILQTAV